MTKIAFAVAITILVAMTMTSGCLEEGKFIGSWENNLEIVVFTFNKDNTYEGTFTHGTWWTEDGQLFCNSSIGTTVYTYSFSNNNKNLLLEGQIITYLTKVET